MSHPDDRGRALLALLVDRLNQVVPGEPQTYIGYKEAHDALGLELLGPTYGESLKHQGLVSLADWTVAEGKPGITGIIVDQKTLTPGTGYFSLFGKTQDDFEWWSNQVSLSKGFDWSPYLPRTTVPDVKFSQAKEQTSPREAESRDVVWTNQEVEHIVNDYFEMLFKELRGEPYSKTEHRRNVLPKLNGRSKGAVEFKHQNVSAILAKLGYPYIEGYKPAKNYQNILSDAVEEYIKREPLFFRTLIVTASSEDLPTVEPGQAVFENCLEAPPESSKIGEFAELQSRSYIGRRFDYAKRESENRRLGELGEHFVIAVERDRLLKAGKPELAFLESVALQKLWAMVSGMM